MLSPYSPFWSIGIRGGVACGAASDGNMLIALRYRQYLLETRPAKPFTLRTGDAGGVAGCEPTGPTDAISSAPDAGAELALIFGIDVASPLPLGTAADGRGDDCGGATLDANPRVGRSPSKPDPANGSPPSEATVDAGVGCWPEFVAYARTLAPFELDGAVPFETEAECAPEPLPFPFAGMAKDGGSG